MAKVDSLGDNGAKSRKAVDACAPIVQYRLIKNAILSGVHFAFQMYLYSDGNVARVSQMRTVNHTIMYCLMSRMSSFVEAIEAGSVVRVNDILSFLAVSSN